MKREKITLDVRESFFTIKEVRFRDRLPRDPIPRDIQGKAGCGSEHLMELKVSLFTAGELGWLAFKGWLSNSNDRMILRSYEVLTQKQAAHCLSRQT